jgi:hypothetical protein
MRQLCHAVTDIDRQLEDAARATQQLDAARWREQVRPAAMRLFAARTATLHVSRALLKLLVEELYPDDLFTELVGDLDRVPLRRCRWSRSPSRFATVGDATVSPASPGACTCRWPQTRSTSHPHDATPGHHDANSSARLDPVKAFRFAPTPCGAHGLDRLSVEPRTALT